MAGECLERVSRAARECGVPYAEARAVVSAGWHALCFWLMSRDVWNGCAEKDAEGLEVSRALYRMPGFGTFACTWTAYMSARWRRLRRATAFTRRGRPCRPWREGRWADRHPALRGMLEAAAQAAVARDVDVDGKGK